MITITDQEFYPNKTWDKPIPFNNPQVFKSHQWVELFDQNGYRLTHLEQEYSIANSQLFVLHRDEKSIRKTWMTDGVLGTGPHLNHAFLFERKSYSGEALEQLREFAKTNNLINKLINYKGKWGIDFSMDYVDSFGNSMELLHFEYDSCNLNEVQEIKGIVEEKISVVDWIKASKLMLQRKDEWIDLEFFEQSKWKTDFFGLPSERFKLVSWE